MQAPLFSSSEVHRDHQRLGHLYVDSLPASIPSDHGNGIKPRATQTIAYGGPPIEPPFYTERLTSWGLYPVPQHAMLSNSIPQQSPPLGQAFSMTDALGFNVLGRHTAEASHGPPQYDTQVRLMSDSSRLWFSLATQETQGFLGDPIDPLEPLGHGVIPPPTYGVVVDASLIPKSRARNWRCPASGCLSFCRRQERNRHLLIHLPQWIHCPYPGCSWRGGRLDLFRRHWDRDSNHPSSSRDLDDRQFMTYDPRPLVGKVEKGSLSIRDAKNYAMLMVRKKASDVGKPELCENPWGRKGRSVQRLG